MEQYCRAGQAADDNIWNSTVELDRPQMTTYGTVL